MDEDSAIVKQYLQAGAIPIVKGIVPQIGSSDHDSNPVFGESKNPHDFARVCGGSSGGECALVASKCVPFSVGTDIAGSLRTPAAFCGVYSMKATAGRVTDRGVGDSNRERFDDFNHLKTVPGPIGSSVDDVITGFKVQSDP